MINRFSDFLSQYNEFKNIVQEYALTYQYMQTQFNTRESQNKSSLLHELQIIENEDRKSKIQLQNRVHEQIKSLQQMLYNVEQNERYITDKKFLKYKEEYKSTDSDEKKHYTQKEINEKVQDTIKSIKKITNSKMPRSVAAICSFFNGNFRKNYYQQIVENRQQLEEMIAAAEKDVQDISEQLQKEITITTATRVSLLQNKKGQMESARIADNEAILKQLKELLLNGLEEIFSNDSIYSNAHDYLTQYLETYVTDGRKNMAETNSFLIGLLSQDLNVSDDGTLEDFLTENLPDGVYSNGNVLLPIAVDKYCSKPVCINYFSGFNDSLFSLFTNYAAQMMNLFADIGITAHLVDCTNMGEKYSEFTFFENIDKDKHVHVVRTMEELKMLLESLSEYIIESNSSYLKNIFQNVKEYNEASTIKRKLQVLIVSNISEITSGEMLSKLSSIMRNGCRCGVITLIGVSTDECQVSGLISQTRLNEINTIMDMCDKIFMSSSGELSFGNALPHFFAPPEMNKNKVQTIIQNCVQNNEETKIPLMEHIIEKENFFSEKCYDSIKIPIGVDALGNEYVLNFNKEASYMLIGGNPACGKSSLIHTIILQCITRYSPEDLVLYVADLKVGSEFDIYVKKRVKFVKVVLDDSEPEVSASFLKFIKANVEMRLEIFSLLGSLSGEIIRNIEQFYQVNNSRHLVEHIPRMLVILDEFQSLYDSSRETGEITNWLVRMCRTVGISIIMASQRVQGNAASVANSFSNQTKDFFVYRAMFKLPYSGAREIMSDNCSDTNRENSALRKAQTLKNGQIIINSNMGATEEDNTTVQCYYPDNKTIEAVCRKVVEKLEPETGIIMNSEGEVVFDDKLFFENPNYILGESNRLYYDTCNKNTDVFIDNNMIGIVPEECNRLIACGNDSQVMGSCFWSLLVKQSAVNAGNYAVCILQPGNTINWLQIPDYIRERFHISDSAETFIEKIRTYQKYQQVLAVIMNPYLFGELKKDTFSAASEAVQTLLECLKDKKIFTLILTDSIKRLKDECSYMENEIPYRVISVGNIAGIRSAMTLEAGDKISDSMFNTVRPNLIKAYYYNKETDKYGRLRMYPVEQLIVHMNLNAISDMEQQENEREESDNGYSGLFGN